MASVSLFKECEHCGGGVEKPRVESVARWAKRRFCSLACKSDSQKGKPAWNKGISRWWKSKSEFKKGHKTWNKGLKGFNSGPDHYLWKGDAAGSDAIHNWVKRRLGRPMKCEQCGIVVDSPFKIHWSNKSGKYKRDLKDWQRFCVPCHKRYDLRRLGK